VPASEKVWYEFGPFRLDCTARLLFRSDQLVAVPPKALDLLLVLADKRGEVVSKDELMRAVWRGEFVEEGNVAHHIGSLRRIFGARCADKIYIRTVPKRGYQFVAKVHETRQPIGGPCHSAVCNLAGPTAPRRVIVLPFYQVREDNETAFLCFSLPDAISSSLSGLRRLIVRSSRVAERFAGPAIDVKTIARETHVDAIVTGSLLCAGEDLRITTQLLDAHSGTVLWTHETQLTRRGLFEFQDEVVHRILASLVAPLGDSEGNLLRRDVPNDARAYEYYLRANRLSNAMDDLVIARDLYARCLEDDPLFAPAWARLARCCRILAKYGCDPDRHLLRAEQALQRAFRLNPGLPWLQALYAQHEAETGHGTEALVRLLDQINDNPNDADLYSAMVHVSRYAGLAEISLAAHLLARRVDASVRTTVLNTHFIMGNYELVLAMNEDTVGYVNAMALDALGRGKEALEYLRECEDANLPPLMQLIITAVKVVLDGKREEAVERLRDLNVRAIDPEGFFFRARLLARLGETTDALASLRRAMQKGFYCVPALSIDRYLEPLRSTVSFSALLQEAESLSSVARTAFVDAGGERLIVDT
jgi:DNA-binding winged helix-turn-helix (wHTH) protein/tetratricopeptide (TPR) repeat protein